MYAALEAGNNKVYTFSLVCLYAFKLGLHIMLACTIQCMLSVSMKRSHEQDEEESRKRRKLLQSVECEGTLCPAARGKVTQGSVTSCGDLCYIVSRHLLVY